MIPAHTFVGAEDAPRLGVFMHGVLGAGHNLRSFAKKLVEKRPDYRFALLDLRYHGTNLTSQQCFATTGDYRGVFTGSGRSNWCGHSVVATLSVDLQWSKLPYK